MSTARVDVNRDSFGSLYMWSLVTAGAAIVLGSLYTLPFRDLDARFFFLCLMVMARLEFDVAERASKWSDGMFRLLGLPPSDSLPSQAEIERIFARSWPATRKPAYA